MRSATARWLYKIKLPLEKAARLAERTRGRLPKGRSPGFLASVCRGPRLFVPGKKEVFYVFLPGEFLPIAEETELIIPITEWVLEEACRQVREWQAQFPLGPTFSVSTNLSAKYFAKRELQERIGALLAENGLDSYRLKLEITESRILENPISVARTLACRSDSGVKVQIDDFGTGYSSLGHLSSLRVHGLKMDQSFVAKLGADEKNAAIVRSIISLGENLELDVIAEGVETAEQLDYLRQVDCPYAQGFLFARPMEPKAAAGLLREASVRSEVLLAAPSLSSR